MRAISSMISRSQQHSELPESLWGLLHLGSVSSTLNGGGGPKLKQWNAVQYYYVVNKLNWKSEFSTKVLATPIWGNRRFSEAPWTTDPFHSSSLDLHLMRFRQMWGWNSNKCKHRNISICNLKASILKRSARQPGQQSPQKLAPILYKRVPTKLVPNLSHDAICYTSGNSCVLFVFLHHHFYALSSLAKVERQRFLDLHFPGEPKFGF